MNNPDQNIVPTEIFSELVACGHHKTPTQLSLRRYCRDSFIYDYGYGIGNHRHCFLNDVGVVLVLDAYAIRSVLYHHYLYEQARLQYRTAMHRMPLPTIWIYRNGSKIFGSTAILHPCSGVDVVFLR